jgi:hypothetical protein
LNCALYLLMKKHPKSLDGCPTFGVQFREAADSSVAASSDDPV